MPLDDYIKDNILKSIELGGAASEENAISSHLVIGSRSNINAIMDSSSGLPRLRTNVLKKFSLILGQPKALLVMNSFEIRCVFCMKVITYPAWYFKIEYSINHFHYFICFDETEPSRPTTRCYRRNV